MTEDEKIRLDLMQNPGNFEFTPGAQFTNGAGISFAIRGRDASILTVGKFWISLTHEFGIDRNGGEGITFYLHDDQVWSCESASPTPLTAQERNAVSECLKQALSGSYGYVTVESE